jgi:hypothetical protein
VLIQVLVLLWQGRNRAGAISRSAICGHFQDQAVSRVSRADANALVKANETRRQARRPIAKVESGQLKVNGPRYCGMPRAVLTSGPSLASVRPNTVK